MKWGRICAKTAGLRGCWRGIVHAAAPPLSVVILGHRAEDPRRTPFKSSNVETISYDRFASPFQSSIQVSTCLDSCSSTIHVSHDYVQNSKTLPKGNAEP
jgi:hypothetical protein